jgi:hypothetical protein
MNFLKTITVALVLLAAMFLKTSAQSEAFKVLAKKGAVTVNSGGKSAEWQNISTGFLLYSADKIKLDGNSYVSMVHPANGRSIELKTPGTYTVSDLVKKATAKTNGVANKYASYVGKELSKVNEPINPGEKHQSNMGSTGSVERAFGDEVTTMDVTESAVGTAFGMLNIPASDYSKTVKKAVETVRMKIPMPKSSYIIDSLVTFAWHPANAAEQYVVTLADDEGRVLFEIIAKDTFLTVDLSPYTLEKERCYNWRVTAEVFPPAASGDQCIMLLPANSFKNIRDTLMMIQSEFTEDSPLQALTLGHFYEENQLFLNALTEFRNAHLWEPEVDEYRLAYARFLERVGLDEEANAVRMSVK